MKTLFLSFGVALLTLPPCPAQAPATGQDAQQAMAEAAKFFQALTNGTNNPLRALGGKAAVDFRQLKAQLPESLAGLRRTNARGQKTGVMGANVTTAEGEYGEGDGSRLAVKITDLGAMGALGSLAGMGWTASEIDSEGDEGYERTTEYGGNKGLEKYQTATRSGSVNILVAGRFMVEITGREITPEQLMTAALGVDLAALASLGASP